MTDMAALIQQFDGVVRRRLRAIVSQDDVDDVCQEVWLRVWRNFDSFRGDSAVSSWLFRVATNAAFDHLRRLRRQSRFSPLPLNEVIASGIEPIDDASNQHRALAAKQEIAIVARQLRKRSPRDRVAIAHLVAGRTFAETATALGLAQGTVKSRVMRARTALRALRVA